MATGTDDGNVSVVNVFTGEVKWKSAVCNSGYVLIVYMLFDSF